MWAYSKMNKQCKLATLLDMTDLQAYDRIWTLMNTPHKWPEIKNILDIDMKPYTIQKNFMRLSTVLKKPHALRGQKLKKG